MPARLAAASGHTMSLEEDAGTGGALTNSGDRTAGCLENIGTATSNSFTMTEVIKIKETVNAQVPGGGPEPGSFDGLETAAGPFIKVKSISIPSSYQGESLSFSHASSSSENPSNFTICPDIKITCTLGTSTVSAGVGFQEVTAVITGPVKEMDDWVIPWTPETSVPKFNGSDFATTRSAGYGRENGMFVVTFVLEYGLLPFSDGDSPIPTQEKTWTISIINNADNDKDVYLSLIHI